MIEAGLCRAARHALSEPVRAESGALLCRVCIGGLERDTLDLVRMHEGMLMDQAWRIPSDAPMVSGTREKPMPLMSRQAGARMHIEVVLCSWAWWVTSTRQMYFPAVPTITSSAAVIIASSEWLARHEGGVQCADDLRDLITGWVRGVAHPSGGVRASAGVCPLCGAEAIGIIRPAEDERESMIICSANDQHQWSPHEWSLVLGWDVRDGATVDGEAAVALLRISADALRQLISRGRIARSEGGSFALADLQRLYGELWGAIA